MPRLPYDSDMAIRINTYIYETDSSVMHIHKTYRILILREAGNPHITQNR